MRVEGTDAINTAIGKAIDTKLPPRDQQNIVAAQMGTIDGKSINQLTDFEKRELPIADKVVIDAIERANRAISGSNRKFEFSVHEPTKQIMVKVLDSETNEVIREIPPEKILNLVAKLWEMAGIIVDERR